MKRNEAIKRAKERARKTKRDFYVILEPDWNSNFQVCDETYLESYYYGCTIVCCADPLGTVHY